MNSSVAVMRTSPVVFSSSPLELEERHGWQVVLEYEGQGNGPFLVDLSHCAKWDLQDRELDDRHPWGLNIPGRPGQSLMRDGWLVNRMNRTQAQAWRIDGAMANGLDEPMATDITDGLCLLALVGRNVPEIMERITTLDVFAQDRPTPGLMQGPVLHIPCQLVNMGLFGDTGAVVCGFSRGYGQTMADAVLAAGAPHGLKPGGEGVFTRLFEY
jgi:hypothetical protein